MKLDVRSAAYLSCFSKRWTDEDAGMIASMTADDSCTGRKTTGRTRRRMRVNERMRADEKKRTRFSVIVGAGVGKRGGRNL